MKKTKTKNRGFQAIAERKTQFLKTNPENSSG